MAKKDSAFYVNKAQVLRSFGIEAQPVTEQTVVDVQWNEGAFKALADSKGQSVDELMATVDKAAEGSPIFIPKAKSTKELRAEVQGEMETKEDVKTEVKASKKKAAPKKKAVKKDESVETKEEEKVVEPKMEEEVKND